MSDVRLDERRQHAFSPTSVEETVTIRPFRIPYPDVICIRNNRGTIRQMKGNEKDFKRGDVPTMRRALSIQTCARKYANFIHEIGSRPADIFEDPYIHMSACGLEIYRRQFSVDTTRGSIIKNHFSFM